MGESDVSRRKFHSIFIYGLQSLIAAALAIPAAIYLLVPPRSRKQGEWVEIADLAKVKPGTPEEVVFRRTRVDGWRMLSEKATAWVVKLSDQEVVAFAPQCTHLGCAYSWDESKKTFACPCHTSAFSIDGKVLGGPAPRPLDRYVTEIRGTKLLVSTKIQKSA
jgi:menaquinol-cytochrome c reductase iron-sulfur subunit